MKTNKDYVLRTIAGESVLIPTGKATQQFNGMLNLTESAAFIWKQVDTAANLKDIVTRLLEEYEVDESVASEDVYGMVRAFYDHGLISEVPEFEEK